MKSKRITTQILLNELLKFGSFKLNESIMKYEVNNDSEELTDFVAISNKPDCSFRQFLNNCSVGFHTGISDIFDKLNEF